MENHLHVGLFLDIKLIYAIMEIEVNCHHYKVFGPAIVLRCYCQVFGLAVITRCRISQLQGFFIIKPTNHTQLQRLT